MHAGTKTRTKCAEERRRVLTRAAYDQVQVQVHVQEEGDVEGEVKLRRASVLQGGVHLSTCISMRRSIKEMCAEERHLVHVERHSSTSTSIGTGTGTCTGKSRRMRELRRGVTFSSAAFEYKHKYKC